MKQLCPVLLIASLLLLVFALSRSAAIVTARERPALAVEANHDLGRAAVGQARAIEVKLANMGNAELLVTEVKGNCECSIATSLSKVIAPGGMMPLKVTLTPKKPGRRKQQIMIRSNDPLHPVTVLTITSDVYDPPLTTPATMAAGAVEAAR